MPRAAEKSRVTPVTEILVFSLLFLLSFRNSLWNKQSFILLSKNSLRAHLADLVCGVELQLICSNLLEVKAQCSCFSAQEPNVLPNHRTHRTGRKSGSYALSFRSVQVNGCQNMVKKWTCVITSSWPFNKSGFYLTEWCVTDNGYSVLHLQELRMQRARKGPLYSSR